MPPNTSYSRGVKFFWYFGRWDFGVAGMKVDLGG